MRDQVTFYLDRARAAARAAAIGVATPAAPALAGMARTFSKIHRDASTFRSIVRTACASSANSRISTT